MDAVTSISEVADGFGEGTASSFLPLHESIKTFVLLDLLRRDGMALQDFKKLQATTKHLAQA